MAEARIRKPNPKYLDTPVSSRRDNDSVNDNLISIRDQIRTIERQIQASSKVNASGVRPKVYATSDSVRPRSHCKPDISKLKQTLFENSQPTLDVLRADHALQNAASSCLDEVWEEQGRPSSSVPASSKGKVSGINKKALDVVENELLWPHSQLQYQYVNQNVSFQNLNFPLFVAGELEIITNDSLSVEERTARLEFLKVLSYEHNSYSFNAITDWYASYIRNIELGRNSWNFNFYKSGQAVLSRYRPEHFDAGNSNVSTVVPRKPKSPKVFFCAAFNKGVCSLASPHSATLKGKVVTVSHVCATCLLKDKTSLEHSEVDSRCPHQVK